MDKVENNNTAQAEKDLNMLNLFQPEAEVRYGIIMEKLCTKLRRIAMVGAYPHKAEVADLLTSSLGLQKTVNEDQTLGKETKDKLLTSVDTLNWFMGSLVEEIADVEKLNKTTGNQTTAPQNQGEEDFDYFG